MNTLENSPARPFEQAGLGGDGLSSDGLSSDGLSSGGLSSGGMGGEAGKKTLLATGSIFGALATTSCCIAPLVLFSLGIGGAWIGNLTALYPYKPIFITATLVFLAGGFYLAYRKPKTACAPGGYCASPASGRVLKSSLWISTLLVAAALAFPYIAPYLLQT